MSPNKIELKGLTLPSNILCAPLAGYTNAPFRDICERAGAGLTFTEMVSAKGLCYGSEKTKELLYLLPGQRRIKACQIFGSEPKFMRKAAESEELSPFEIIDINMGCPVPKIYNNGEGSALMNDLPLASRIISECKKSNKIISVKFRIGLSAQKLQGVEFAKMCEDAGADLITVHGRTRDKMYSGGVDFAEIERVKNAVKIPVIANGGVFSVKDAEELIAKTGADGVMIARGAMYDPWIFSLFSGAKPNVRADVLNQISLTRQIYGERFACVYMRKMISFYIRGRANASEARMRLMACKSSAEAEEIAKTLF